VEPTHKGSRADLEASFSQLAQRLQRTEYRFDSRIPVVGALIVAIRRWWHEVAGRWALKHAVAEQVAFDAEVLRLLRLLQSRIEALEVELAQAQAQARRSEIANTLRQQTLTRDVEVIAYHTGLSQPRF
jgi:hypothetical protein